MKIIFLDFDGVLNSTTSHMYHTFNKPIHSVLWNPAPNPLSVFLVERVLSNEDVYAVISSSHRKQKPLTDIKDILKDSFGFSKDSLEKVIDVTPNLNTLRGTEIQEYLKNNKNITEYCILDDGTDFLKEQKPYLVKTLFDDGYVYKDYIQTLKILKLKILKMN